MFGVIMRYFREFKKGSEARGCQDHIIRTDGEVWEYRNFDSSEWIQYRKYVARDLERGYFCIHEITEVEAFEVFL
jgi:hypothetical protein